MIKNGHEGTSWSEKNIRIYDTTKEKIRHRHGENIEHMYLTTDLCPQYINKLLLFNNRETNKPCLKWANELKDT